MATAMATRTTDEDASEPDADVQPEDDGGSDPVRDSGMDDAGDDWDASLPSNGYPASRRASGLSLHERHRLRRWLLFLGGICVAEDDYWLGASTAAARAPARRAAASNTCGTKAVCIEAGFVRGYCNRVCTTGGLQARRWLTCAKHPILAGVCWRRHTGDRVRAGPLAGARPRLPPAAARTTPPGRALRARLRQSTPPERARRQWLGSVGLSVLRGLAPLWFPELALTSSSSGGRRLTAVHTLRDLVRALTSSFCRASRIATASPEPSTRLPEPRQMASLTSEMISGRTRSTHSVTARSLV